MMNDLLQPCDILEFTTHIVSSYLQNHSVEVDDIPRVIHSVHQTIEAIAHGQNRHRSQGNSLLKPAVPIDESVFDDFIICLEDGKPVRMLRRYLKRVHNMSVEEYKHRWGLPNDYPMVAPKYSERRREIAKTSGLGTTQHRRRLKLVETKAG
jgi:predicted transcriptional regulator